MGHHRLSHLAENDLRDNWLYIAGDNVTAADHMLDRFTSAFELLASNPLLGEAQDDLRPGLRRFVIRNYLVFYQHDHDGIVVVRVLHGARRYGDEFCG